MRNWQLVDGEEMAKADPDSFEVPTRDEKDALRLVDQCKLEFERVPARGGICGERMWVLVTERIGDQLRGTLSNQPVVIESLNFGDVVEFEIRHVLAIQAAPPLSSAN